jgi:TP901 family phage tail tape measure protein
MGKDVKRRFTVSLDIETKDVEKQVKATVGNLKTILTDLGNASDKMTYFKELTDYISQVDAELDAFKKKHGEGMFNKIFGGLDTSLRKEMENILATARTKIAEFNSTATHSGKAGIPGGVNLGAEDLQKKVDDLEEQSERLNNLQFNISKTLSKIQKIDAGESIFPKKHEFSEEEVMRITQEFSELQSTLKNFSGDKSSIEYFELLTKYMDKAAQMSDMFNELTVAGSKNNMLYHRLQQQAGDQGLMSPFKKVKKGEKVSSGDVVKQAGLAAMSAISGSRVKELSAYQDKLDAMIEETDTDIEKYGQAMQKIHNTVSAPPDTPDGPDIDAKIDDVKQLGTAYDELAKKVQKYHELSQRALDDDVDDDEFDALHNEMDALQSDVVASIPDKYRKSVSDMFTQIGDGDVGPEGLLDELNRVLSVEIPQNAQSAFEQVGKHVVDASEYVQGMAAQLKNLFDVLSQPMEAEYKVLINGQDINVKKGLDSQVPVQTIAETYLSNLDRDAIVSAHSHMGSAAGLNGQDLENVMKDFYFGTAKLGATIGNDSINTWNLAGVAMEDVAKAIKEIEKYGTDISVDKVNEIFRAINPQYTGVAKKWDASNFHNLAQYIYDIGQQSSDALTPVERFQNVIKYFAKGVDLSKYQNLLADFKEENAGALFNKIMESEGKDLRVGDISKGSLNDVTKEVQEQKNAMLELRQAAKVTYGEIEKVVSEYNVSRSRKGDKAGADFFKKYFHVSEMPDIEQMFTDIEFGERDLTGVTRAIASHFSIDPDDMVSTAKSASPESIYGSASKQMQDLIDQYYIAVREKQELANKSYGIKLDDFNKMDPSEFHKNFILEAYNEYKRIMQELANMPIVETDDDKKNLQELQEEALHLQATLSQVAGGDRGSLDYAQSFGIPVDEIDDFHSAVTGRDKAFQAIGKSKEQIFSEPSRIWKEISESITSDIVKNGDQWQQFMYSKLPKNQQPRDFRQELYEKLTAAANDIIRKEQEKSEQAEQRSALRKEFKEPFRELSRNKLLDDSAEDAYDSVIKGISDGTLTTIDQCIAKFEELSGVNLNNLSNLSEQLTLVRNIADAYEDLADAESAGAETQEEKAKIEAFKEQYSGLMATMQDGSKIQLPLGDEFLEMSKNLLKNVQQIQSIEFVRKEPQAPTEDAEQQTAALHEQEAAIESVTQAQQQLDAAQDATDNQTADVNAQTQATEQLADATKEAAEAQQQLNAAQNAAPDNAGDVGERTDALEEQRQEVDAHTRLANVNAQIADLKSRQAALDAEAASIQQEALRRFDWAGRDTVGVDADQLQEAYDLALRRKSGEGGKYDSADLAVSMNKKDAHLNPNKHLAQALFQMARFPEKYGAISGKFDRYFSNGDSLSRYGADEMIPLGNGKNIIFGESVGSYGHFGTSTAVTPRIVDDNGNVLDRLPLDNADSILDTTSPGRIGLLGMSAEELASLPIIQQAYNDSVVQLKNDGLIAGAMKYMGGNIPEYIEFLRSQERSYSDLEQEGLSNQQQLASLRAQKKAIEQEIRDTQQQSTVTTPAPQPSQAAQTSEDIQALDNALDEVESRQPVKVDVDSSEVTEAEGEVKDLDEALGDIESKPPVEPQQPQKIDTPDVTSGPELFETESGQLAFLDGISDSAERAESEVQDVVDTAHQLEQIAGQLDLFGGDGDAEAVLSAKKEELSVEQQITDEMQQQAAIDQPAEEPTKVETPEAPVQTDIPDVTPTLEETAGAFKEVEQSATDAADAQKKFSESSEEVKDSAQDSAPKDAHGRGGNRRYAYGATAVASAKLNYDTLRNRAEAYSGSAVVGGAMEKYKSSLNQLIELQNQFKVGQKLSPEQEAQFTKLKNECNAYGRAVKKIIDESDKLAASSEKPMQIMSDIPLDTFDDRAEALRNYVQETYGASAAIGNLNGDATKLSFTIKNGDGTITNMTASLNAARTAIAATSGETKKATGAFGKFLDEFGTKFKQIGTYFAASFGWQEIWQAVKQGVQYVKEIDSALTELKKVTNETDATYDKFLKTMSKSASAVGSTVADLTSSAADWGRLGYSLEEAGRLAETTAKLLNVSEFASVDEATSALVSSLQAFTTEGQDVGQRAEEIVDILNNIGNKYPVATNELAEGLATSGAALVAANNSIEEQVALLSAGNATMQDISSVASGLKIVAARLRGTTSDIDDDADSAITNVSKLQEKIQALTAEANGGKGINIIDEDGSYKSTYQILTEISKIFDKMDDMSQASLLELIAGKNRSSVVAAILQNGDILQNAYSDALSSEGSSQKELDTYLDSIQGRIDLFNNSLQTMWMNFINSDFVKIIVDIGSFLVTAVDNVGVIETAIIGIVGYLTAIKKMDWKDFFSFKGLSNGKQGGKLQLLGGEDLQKEIDALNAAIAEAQQHLKHIKMHKKKPIMACIK